MSQAFPIWIGLQRLGARDATLDEAVRAANLEELWSSERAAVLLDVAHVAGADLGALLRTVRDACEAVLDHAQPGLIDAPDEDEDGLEEPVAE